MMKQRFPKKRYGQRWQIEATYSQDKRRFGSQLAASSTMGQYYEVLLRVLEHNVAILLRLKTQPEKLFSTEHSLTPYCVRPKNQIGE